MNDSVTPRELGRELCISPKRIRDYLRSRYGLLANQQRTRWELTADQARDVRAYFGS